MRSMLTETFIQKAENCLSKGQLERAKVYWWRVYDGSVPGDFSGELALSRLYQLYWREGAYLQAEKTLRSLIRLYPDERRHPYALAHILLEQGKLDAARSLVFELALDPKTHVGAIEIARWMNREL